MLEVCEREGVVFRRVGAWRVARCPFHEEKTGSFQIGSQRPDVAVCRGGGWQGSIFDFWMAKRGVEFKQAVRELGVLAGVTPRGDSQVAWSGRKRSQGGTVPEVTRGGDETWARPALPRLRMLRDDEVVALAELRGLSVEGVRAAAMTFKRGGYALWPQWQGRHDGVWRRPCQVHWMRCRQDMPECAVVPSHGSWVVTDETRWCAQFRRMDGGSYEVKRDKGKGSGDKGVRNAESGGGSGDGEQEQEQEREQKQGIKAWTRGHPAWPIGAAELGSRRCVLMVEGGADMLAAYHFLTGFGLLQQVGVVCMLGAGQRIAARALPAFRHMRVRIMMDADPEKELRSKRRDGTEKVRKIRPGTEAAARWQEQLTAAGAVVETYSLEGLVTAAGEPVKDLNDLALCSAEVVGSAEVMDAFFEWDF